MYDGQNKAKMLNLFNACRVLPEIWDRRKPICNRNASGLSKRRRATSVSLSRLWKQPRSSLIPYHNGTPRVIKEPKRRRSHSRPNRTETASSRLTGYSACCRQRPCLCRSALCTPDSARKDVAMLESEYIHASRRSRCRRYLCGCLAGRI